MRSPLAALWVLAACSTAPPAPRPLVPPKVDVQPTVFAGSVLSGAHRHAPQASLEAPEILDVDVYFLASMPESMEPLAPRTRMVLDVGEEGALRPVARLAPGARLATGVTARSLAASLTTFADTEAVLVGTSSILLGVGASGGLSGRRIERLEQVTHGPQREAITVLVGRPTATSHTVALAIEGIEPDAESTYLTRELLVLDLVPEVDGSPFVVALPSPFEGSSGALAAVVSLRTPTDSFDLEAAREATRLALAATAAAAEQGASQPSDQAVQLRNLRTTLSGLRDIGYERETLALLAADSGAVLAQDLVVIAERELVEAWVARVRTKLGADDAWDRAPSDAATAWAVEAAAWAELGARLDEDALAPSLRGLLARHGGEVGRFPGVLGELLDRSTDAMDFQRRLAQENFAFLGTNDPSARARAFDWLTVRGLAPDGYDPFAKRDARRAALRAAEEAALAESQNDATTPDGAGRAPR